MEIPDIRITLLCLFCYSELQADDEKEYKSGDMIKCQECGENNDYDSLIEVVKEKGIKILKNEVPKFLQKEFKDMFKKF